MNIVAYVRVSTTEQATEGVSLEAQERLIGQWVEAMGHTIVGYYRDEGVSGKTIDRPGLKAAIDHALHPSQDTDGLVVLKLDRLVRSVTGLAELMDRFNASGKALLSVRDSLDTTSAGGRLVANIMASVAQWEREVISERTKDALAEKKRQGVQLGRPPSEEVDDADESMIRGLHGAGWSHRRIATHMGLKPSTVRRIVT